MTISGEKLTLNAVIVAFTLINIGSDFLCSLRYLACSSLLAGGFGGVDPILKA